MSDKSVLKNGKIYYQFNNLQNSVHAQGFITKNNQKLLFLPENSDSAILFFDFASLYKSNHQLPQTIRTKDQTQYRAEFFGRVYNSYLKDSTSLIVLQMSGFFGLNEELIFEISHDLDVLAIQRINCKNDTLMMKFVPRKEVYYKHINYSTVCL